MNFDEILNANLVHPDDIEKIWETYNQIFGFYPIGKKTCSNCIRQSLIQIIKYIRLNNIKNA